VGEGGSEINKENKRKSRGVDRKKIKKGRGMKEWDEK